MERDFVRWLCRRLPTDPRLIVGPGDDAAVLGTTPGIELVATTDMLMDGVDFELSRHDPALIGRKALAVNLSDLAAMGARPLAALVAVALPHHSGQQLGQSLLEGMLPLAAELACPVVGGDTNAWTAGLVISVTALGETLPGKAFLRSKARPGDVLLVTGRLGGSILGRHFTFQPRIAEALWLAEHAEIHAAMDISDGLALDLSRLCEASGCGAELDLGRIPISDAAHQLATTDGRAPIEHALSDGEDFELILALPPNEVARLESMWRFPLDLTPIGRCTDHPGLFAIDQHGGRRTLAPHGYEHRLEG